MRHALSTLALCAFLFLPAALISVPTVAGAGEEAVPIGRLTVKEEGFVRVPASTLGAAAPTEVSVTRGGHPVPIAEGGAGDVVFLAYDHATDHSAWGVYELWRLPAPRGGSEPPMLFPVPPAAEAVARRRLAQDRQHGSLAGGRREVYAPPGTPTWFLGRVPRGDAMVMDVSSLGAAPRTEQTLEVEVWATRIGDVTLHAAWGETDLGTATVASAAGGATLSWRVTADAVPPEHAELLLRDVSPPAPPAPEQDVSHGRGHLWIDEIALVGPVAPRIDEQLRVFHAVSNTTLELQVPPKAVAPDTYMVLVGPHGEPLQAPRIETDPAADVPTVRVPLGNVLAGARLFASTSARVIAPTAPRKHVHPKVTAGAARHVILTVPALGEPAAALAKHRTDAGLPSAVVPVEDVYSAYGHGEATPFAIRAFLLDLLERQGAPLEYVLLAGDATYDRTDMLEVPTIPVPMARTIYNGATPADRLYVLPPDESFTGGPAIGRLPFRDAAVMDAYVQRVIAYETNPPAHPSRRLMRFVTNEARFGPLADRLIETMFKSVITTNIPPGYDLEVTFARPASPYMWPPPEFDDHVIDGINEGCLFFTYVGHGFGQGFDRLRIGNRQFPVLHTAHAHRIRCAGTPPVAFVIACTTATFDQVQYEGIGEALMARPHGPIAYWGATRICHPAANTLLGRSIARFMSKGEGRWRLGDILAHARDDVLAPKDDPMRMMIDMALRSLAKGADPERLALEGTWMYTLLGDPAVKMAVPTAGVEVEATLSALREIEVSVATPLPDGTEIHLSLEVPRNRQANKPVAVEDPTDEASYDTIRENHRAVNDLSIARTVLTLENCKAMWTFSLPGDFEQAKLVAKAWAIAEDDVHQGAVVIDIPPPPVTEED